MILHTLNALPDTSACADCLDIIAPGDTLFLLGDGCYAAATGSSVLNDTLDRDITVFVLADDAKARGLIDRLLPAVALTDMMGLVELTETHPRQQAWY